MKKISLMTFFMTSILLFFFNIPTFNAEEVHSKVTGTLLQADETTSTLDTNDTDESDIKDSSPPSKNVFVDNTESELNTKKDNYEKGNLVSRLPQTGEILTWGISLVGVGLIVISLIIILVKRRRYNNEGK